MNRIFKYLGQHTRSLHLEGGGRFSYNGLNESNCENIQTSRKIKRGKKRERKGTQRLLDVSDSLLGRIRLNCAYLTSISFHSCKLDYFSRYFISYHMYFIKNDMLSNAVSNN